MRCFCKQAGVTGKLEAGDMNAVTNGDLGSAFSAAVRGGNPQGLNYQQFVKALEMLALKRFARLFENRRANKSDALRLLSDHILTPFVEEMGLQRHDLDSQRLSHQDHSSRGGTVTMEEAAVLLAKERRIFVKVFDAYATGKAQKKFIAVDAFGRCVDDFKVSPKVSPTHYAQDVFRSIQRSIAIEKVCPDAPYSTRACVACAHFCIL